MDSYFAMKKIGSWIVLHCLPHLLFVYLKSWERMRARYNGIGRILCLSCRKWQKFVCYLEEDFNFIHYLRSRSLGKYELLRSTKVGASTLGPPSCLRAARCQKFGAWFALEGGYFRWNKKICHGFFFSFQWTDKFHIKVFYCQLSG